MSEAGETRELLIIKKRAPLDDGAAKGGVWKIAFADFMTAMMAFFLVMWLVNAANEETKIQVASYFNPVRLVDAKPQPRGLEDIRDDNQPSTTSEAGAAAEGDKSEDSTVPAEPPPGAGGKPGSAARETALMRDPEAALDRIAAASQMRSAPDGLDPFAPAHWRAADPMLQPKADSEFAPGKDSHQATSPTEASPGETSRAAAGARKQPDAGPDQTTAKAGTGKPNESTLPGLAEEIRSAFEIEAGGLNPDISVEKTPEGVLISLTDNAQFGMFAIASAEPNARTIALADKLAAVLRQRDVRIIVRGHTDGRPFRSDVYDNWRLSSARAHMAAYMLERGGVPEEAIIRIEGYADRKLKRPDDPEADENRRIEILVEPGRAQ
jgi:chemotaxis protein MotB